MAINSDTLSTFEKIFSKIDEDKATQSRDEFLQAFPINRLGKLSIDDYVIGLQTATFCAYVTEKTRYWASIRSSTAIKLGIYFGRTKGDVTKKFRFAKKFGNSQVEAFTTVKAALLDLVQLAASPEISFQAIEKNRLSPMFKAKILSLYFPERFLNVCSAEHLDSLAQKLGVSAGLPKSEIQHRLIGIKNTNLFTRNWSNPKFMSFLYATYINKSDPDNEHIIKPHKQLKQRVNFEDIQKIRSAIGEAAEIFAIEWEKQRLIGAGLTELIADIDDRRDRPGYGYDYLSYSAVGQPRYVEVKAVGSLRNGEGHRLFLSENERGVSLSSEHKDNYFFYLVFFNSQKKPERVVAVPAYELYKTTEITAASYMVRFNFGKSKESSTARLGLNPPLLNMRQ